MKTAAAEISRMVAIATVFPAAAWGLGKLVWPPETLGAAVSAAVLAACGVAALVAYFFWRLRENQKELIKHQENKEAVEKALASFCGYVRLHYHASSATESPDEVANNIREGLNDALSPLALAIPPIHPLASPPNPGSHLSDPPS